MQVSTITLQRRKHKLTWTLRRSAWCRRASSMRTQWYGWRVTHRRWLHGSEGWAQCSENSKSGSNGVRAALVIQTPRIPMVPSLRRHLGSDDSRPWCTVLGKQARAKPLGQRCRIYLAASCRVLVLMRDIACITKKFERMHSRLARRTFSRWLETIFRAETKVLSLVCSSVGFAVHVELSHTGSKQSFAPKLSKVISLVCSSVHVVGLAVELSHFS